MIYRLVSPKVHCKSIVSPIYNYLEYLNNCIVTGLLDLKATRPRTKSFLRAVWNGDLRARARANKVQKSIFYYNDLKLLCFLSGLYLDFHFAKSKSPFYPSRPCWDKRKKYNKNR